MEYGWDHQEDQSFYSYKLPKCQNIWHCYCLYLPLILLSCLRENEMHQYEAGKQAYFPPDVEVILSSKALICHSALGKTQHYKYFIEVFLYPKKTCNHIVDNAIVIVK